MVSIRFCDFPSEIYCFCYNGNFVQPKENILMFYFTMCNKPRTFNPLTAKLFDFNFQPLEVVLRWRDPQLQVSENYSDLTKWRSTLFKSCWLMSHFIFNIFKMWYLMCLSKMKTRIYAAPAVKGLPIKTYLADVSNEEFVIAVRACVANHKATTTWSYGAWKQTKNLKKIAITAK